MSAPSSITAVQTAAQRRAALIPWAIALPLIVGIGILSWRAMGPVFTAITCGALVVAVLRLSLLAAAKIDPNWMARQLDRARPDLENSSDLVFRDTRDLSVLARLQRERIEARLAQGPAVDLRAPWPTRIVGWTWLGGLALVAAAIWIPGATSLPSPSAAPAPPSASTAAARPLVASLALEVTPPAYTGLPKRTQSEFAARVPEGSELLWRVQFSESIDDDAVESPSAELRSGARPSGARLKIHDGASLELQFDGSAWIGSRVVQKSTLYRLQFDDPATPEAQLPLERLVVIADRPPQLRVTAPDRSLMLATPGQTRWALNLEASDDYGLGAASLLIRHAKGSGESITVTETRLPLSGAGDARARRYQRTLDLRALEFAQGDDLIVRFSVSDQRRPTAQTTQSSSFILRWPDAPSTEAAGIEGVVEKVLPAYFRSQRQIIIDSEALLAEKPKLAHDPFVARSDAIGVDQRLLRMRYGQFLGEESEVADAPHAHDEDADHEDDHADEPAAAPTASAGFGESASVIEAYGHTHDDAEAATLLDPKTRALLKSALDEMWQAELHLRQGDPAKALPFEYRALGFIKQVQQASRIYLARVGLELPPVDESRRLSGDREGLRNRPEISLSATHSDQQAAALWRELASADRGDVAQARMQTAIVAFETWLRAHETELPDVLDVVLSLDEFRGDPGCDACRERLRQQLWRLLPRPAPSISTRAAPNAAGRAYLRALTVEPSP